MSSESEILLKKIDWFEYESDIRLIWVKIGKLKPNRI